MHKNKHFAIRTKQETDDYLKMVRGIDINVLMDLIRKDVKIFLEWADYTGVSISSEKTKLMCITNKRNIVKPTLKIHGKEIEWVSEYKYLGVSMSVHGCERAKSE